MFFKNYWKTISFALFILIGSITSGKELNKIPFLGIQNMDKLIHFFLYFILIVSLLNSITKSYFQLSNYKKIYALVIVILYSGLMEFGQYAFTSDRSAEFYDLIANCCGAIMGLLIYPILSKINIIKWL